MELLGSNIKNFKEKKTPKKVPYISGNDKPKKLLIFQEATFQARKIKKKFTPQKIFIFQEMEVSNFNIKNFLIFSQKKAFLIFLKWTLHFSSREKIFILPETKTPRKFRIFSQKKAFLIFQETELFYISERNFPSSKGTF